MQLTVRNKLRIQWALFAALILMGQPACLRLEAEETEINAADQLQKSEEAVLRDLAKAAMKKEDYAQAETYFLKLLTYPGPKEERRGTLLELGRLQEDKLKKPVKAAAIYEQVLSMVANDPEAADLSLRLGRIYRELGAEKMALNKFYNVLYASLRVKDGQTYKSMALRAQLEIANTHFLNGNIAEASKFYSRLKLLELPEAERAEVNFRSVYILHLTKESARLLVAAREFLRDFPSSAFAPECQYLLIENLRSLNRPEEAVAETIKLLKAEQGKRKEHPEEWARWQQKTGNEFGNELYASGDSLHALTVYQTLAEISDAPEWRWPTVYQIGLCFERLRHPERAVEAYQYILKNPVPADPSKKAGEVGVNLTALREMAQWRVDHLQWIHKTEADLAPLLAKKPVADLPQASFMARPNLRPEGESGQPPPPAPTSTN